MEVNYGGGGSGAENWIYFLLFLFISLAITWLIIYTAVRAAVGHALDRMKPRLTAEATPAPDGVEFVVSNVGSAPAVDVTVRWLDRPFDEPLARAPFLGAGAKLEWTIAAPAVPGSTPEIRTLKLSWARDPDSGRESVDRVVRIPLRLSTAG
jgi:hypothetical protein